jgi:uncharacterized membrane protein YdbT with pleckstrin-like domain
MGYIDQSLVPGETIAYRARLHWIVVAPILLAGGALVLAGAVALLFALLGSGTARDASVPLSVAGAVLLLAGTGWIAFGMVRWMATEINVTTRRVLIKTGVLTRRTTEVLLSKVESVSVEESVSARIFGFGRVTIHGTGGTPETFDRIAGPQRFRRQVQIQIEALHGPGKIVHSA